MRRFDGFVLIVLISAAIWSCSFPSVRAIAPLFAVDRPQAAPARGKDIVIDNFLLEFGLRDRAARFLAITVERPISPDMDVIFEQRLNIRTAGQKPQHLLDRGLPVNTLSGEDWHGAVGETEARQRAKDRKRSHAGPVNAPVSMFKDLLPADRDIEFLMSHWSVSRKMVRLNSRRPIRRRSNCFAA